MTLLKIIESIDRADLADIGLSEDVIYAREPWAFDSDAMITPAPDDNNVPEAAARLEMMYFLEVNIAKEALGWVANELPSIEEKCQRVIRYAIMDA